MDTLRNLFKNKDKPFLARLAVMACLGVILFISSSVFLSGTIPSNREPDNGAVTERPSNDTLSYEKDLEKRLSELLSMVDGAGKVDVMITISYGNEIVLAEDQSVNETILTETDSTGGTRENQARTIDSKKIILQSAQGGQQPLIIKEIVPKVEGVIIVAEGGDDILIKEALMNAAKTVLGIEIHKVQVLKMK